MDNDGGYISVPPRSPSPDGKFRKHKHIEKGLLATWKRQSFFLKLAAITLIICLTLAFVSRRENVQSDATASASGLTKTKGNQDSCSNMDVAIPKIPDSRNGTLVLVTGGAGFVGSNLVDRLLSLGYRVRILDNLTSGSIRNVPIEDDRVDLIVGDVSNLQTVQTAIKGVEIVFHLAAQRRGAVSDPHEIRKLIESHTQGIWNVMETAKLNGVSRVIYTSTFLSHGRHSGDAHIVSESGSEYLIKSLQSLFNIPTVVLRLASVYGPRQDDRGVLHLDKLPGSYIGDANNAYDFIHVHDVVEGIILAAQKLDLNGESIDLGTGSGVRLTELASKFALTPSSTVFHSDEAAGFIADTCKMKEVLEYAPQKKIFEEIPKLLEAIKKGNAAVQPWFSIKMMRSTPWLLPRGRRHLLPWIGLDGKLDKLIERLSPEDNLLNLVIWNNEPRISLLNHVYSLVAKGKAAAYIVAATGPNLHECLQLNLPCWDITAEEEKFTKTRLMAHLATILLKKGHNVHLGEVHSIYQGSVLTSYVRFENANVILKQNIDSIYQVHTENAFIKSNRHTIEMFESLSKHATEEGLFESLHTVDGTWGFCFDPQGCSEVNSKDQQASLALYLNPMQCTPSLFNAWQQEDRYFLRASCLEIEGDQLNLGVAKGWLLRQCADRTDSCSLQEEVPLEWLQPPSNIREFGPHGDDPYFIVNWSPAYLTDVTVQKFLEAPWLAPRRQKMFHWQGHHNNFEELLSIQSISKRVSLIYFNKGFWKVAANCLHSMVKYGNGPNHIIAALDTATLEHCVDKNLPCVNGSSLTFHDFDKGYSWNEMHWLKPALANYAVNLGYIVHAGDADISYVRDIWASYLPLQERTGADLIATDDRPYSPLNTGNVLLMPTFRTQALYHNYVTLGLQRPTANDQYLFHEFQWKNFKICKTKAECDDIHKYHGKEIMAAIFILPTPHSGCFWDGLQNPDGIDKYICETHAEQFLYEHGACRGGEKYEWLRDYGTYFLEECGNREDCPYVPKSWLGQKHRFLPCGPKTSWNIFPSDNPKQ